MIVYFIESFGNEFCFTALYGIYGGLCEGLHLYEPLCRYFGLNGRAAAVAGADIVLVILCAYEEAAFFEILNYLLSCFVSVHTRVIRIIVRYLGIIGHYADNREIVALADFKVVRVMCGGDLYGTGTELCINIIIGNNGYLSVYKRENESFPNYVGISFIVGIYGYSGISEESFGTGGSYFKKSVTVFHRIADMPEMSRLILIGNLGIGECGFALGTPVYDPFAAVDQTFVKILDKNIFYRV